jgi:hypothetical protein
MRFAALILLFIGSHAGAQCVAESGPGTAALVELYTSEGCSSCPPADRWLSSLGQRYATADVVPLALHVDYWDYIGWEDPYAKREFSLRQRKLSQLQRLALVYTPQVLLQGRDFPGWGSKAFHESIARINAQPARARMRLALLGVDSRGVEVEASAELGERADDAALYLAVYASNLRNHDHVVLEWQGPFAISKRVVERRRLAPLPGANAANSGVVAFVQNRRTGEVLQALMRSAC